MQKLVRHLVLTRCIGWANFCNTGTHQMHRWGWYETISVLYSPVEPVVIDVVLSAIQVHPLMLLVWNERNLALLQTTIVGITPVTGGPWRHLRSNNCATVGPECLRSRIEVSSMVTCTSNVLLIFFTCLEHLSWLFLAFVAAVVVVVCLLHHHRNYFLLVPEIADQLDLTAASAGAVVLFLILLFTR